MSPADKTQTPTKSASKGILITQPPSSGSGDRRLSSDEKQQLIAKAAYFRAQQRGFTPGNELEDWLGAEAEVDRHLLGGPSSGPARSQNKPGRG